MAEVVGAGAVVESGVGTGSDGGEDVFAKGHEVASGFDLTEFVGDDPRTAEMVGRRVACMRLGRKLRRILGDQLARRVNKNGRLLIGNLLNTFAFAIVVIGTDDLVAVVDVLNLRLFIVTIENKLAIVPGYRIVVLNDISVLVVGESLAKVKAVGILINRKAWSLSEQNRKRFLRRPFGYCNGHSSSFESSSAWYRTSLDSTRDTFISFKMEKFR